MLVLPERLRTTHLGVIGLSGVGKSYFLENLIRQDVERKTGFVVFDVHGDLADSVIAYIAQQAMGKPEPQTRTVIIEPFDPEYSIGFNPLEREPHTSPFLQTQELAYILHSRWETKSFGPRTEELLRSALYTLAAHDLTLLELPYLLTYTPFRSRLVRTLREPAIVDYWRGRYDRLSEPMKAAVREPLLTRVSAFLSVPHIREIVAHPKSTFSFRDAMAQGLWVVVNLSKGRLGDENSAVLGSLLFTKLQLDVMARAHVPPQDRRFFSIYADELQNLAGRNFATLVAEARKYEISITAGHQFLHQLSPEMRAAMEGVGARVLFRLNYHDARELAGELDLMDLQYFAFLLTRLGRGEGLFRSGADDPVHFRVLPHERAQPTPKDLADFREQSFRRFAASRAIIRRQITERIERLALPDTTVLLNRGADGAETSAPFLHHGLPH